MKYCTYLRPLDSKWFMVMVIVSLLIFFSKPSLGDSRAVGPGAVKVMTQAPKVSNLDGCYTIKLNNQNAAINLHDASGSGSWITKDTANTPCADGYTLVSFDTQIGLSGIYNSGTYLVAREMQLGHWFYCCPLVNEWKPSN